MGITAAVAFVALAAIPTAQAEDRPDFSPCEDQYLDNYVKAYEADLDVGRNLVDDGALQGDGSVIAVSNKRACNEANTLDLALNPPEPVYEETYAAPAVTGTGGSGGCVGMEAESGTDGYDAYNPASGATGCYQVIPSTAAAFDCDLSTPAGQDACASRICEGQGPGAWSASGANPC